MAATINSGRIPIAEGYGLILTRFAVLPSYSETQRAYRQ
jgi:hypothetical protein